MKGKKVLKLLQITRPTLCSYVKKGIIKTKRLPNGYYEYDEESVYKLLGVDRRDVVVYGRVSTLSQKSSLENQVKSAIEYANSNGYSVSKVYKDVASGLNFDRKEFKSLLKQILDHKIEAVIVTHKDRLTRLSFDMWSELFNEFGCKVIVMNKEEDDDKGIFEDIISMLHCFSMRMYSKRRKKKLELMEEDLKNEE